jgi:threonyl-tRNA synthetase
VDYGREVAATLVEHGLRVQVDDSADTMGAKIRRHQLAKVPYQLVVGDAEAGAGTVAVRARGGRQRKDVAVAAFAAELADEVARRGSGE